MLGFLSFIGVSKSMSFKEWIGVLAVTATSIGFVVLDLRAAAAQEQVKALKEEKRQLERSIEALNELTKTLEDITEDDNILRNIIRQVPDRPLTIQEQSAVREIFKLNLSPRSFFLLCSPDA